MGPRLANGYHELETAFVLLDEPHDTMRILAMEGGQPGVSVRCDVPGIDCSNNTLTKAYAAYMKIHPLPLGFAVTLEKSVPHGAGLGGGSANAAGLLQFFEYAAEERGLPMLGRARLTEVAALVGADVPVFLERDAVAKTVDAGGQTGRPVYLATGIGEKLVPVENPFSGQYLVLVCHDVHVSTAWAFAALDEARQAGGRVAIWEGAEEGAGEGTAERGAEKNRLKANWNLTSKRHQDISFRSRNTALGNDFEQVVFPAHPMLAALRDELIDAGAHTALLSGTGASVFGVFADYATASAYVNTAEHRTFLCAL